MVIVKGRIVLGRWRQCAPRLIRASLDPPESTLQTTSRSVQPFLQGSHNCDRPIDRRTDRPRYSVCNSRPHLRS